MDTVITAREVAPGELEQGLEVRNKIFPPITADDWSRDGARTAAIAFDGEKTIGFIPLALRNFRLVPGVSLRAAFEHSVGTSAEYRSHGIGGKMIEAACGFLPGTADALLVYRGDERSAGYRFYTKTGHSDLHYIRLFVREITRTEEPVIMPPDVNVTAGSEVFITEQDRLLELFEETYATFGGFPQRHPGYWAHALSSTLYAARPHNFYFVQLREHGKLMAYAIIGNEKREGTQGPLKLLEIAASEGSLVQAKAVLQGVCSFAAQAGFARTVVHIGYAHPFAELLPELRFDAQQRSLHVMGLCFDPRALFDQVWQERLNLPGVRLNVWTPKQEVTLLDGGEEPVHTVTLEMKDDTLNAWLLGRIDLMARVKEGTISILNGNEALLAEIARAIPHADWVYHHLDYI